MRDRGNQDDVGLGIGTPGGETTIQRFSHQAMATVFEVYAVHPDRRYASQAAHAAFDLVDRLERELSRFVPNSDIARINDLAAGESTRVSPSTLECLVIARHLFDLTGGAFDVSIGTGLPLLELDPDGFAVRATAGGVKLDVGGIGKGYTVDLMAELLDEWGLGAVLVHGGFSSVLAVAPPAGGAGWPLTLSDPRHPSRVLARLSVSQAALGASGLRKSDHIVDPRTAEPIRNRLAAWVEVRRPLERGIRLQPDCPTRPQADPADTADAAVPRIGAIADGLTTAFMIMSPEAIDALCRRSPELEAWILPAPDAGSAEETTLLHFGGAAR